MFATLLRIPKNLIHSEPGNADNVVQALQEDVLGPIQQMPLASILHSHHMDTETILGAVTAWFCDTEIRRC